MDFFINTAVWEDFRNPPNLENKKLELQLPNFIKSTNKHEYITFIIEDIGENTLEKDILIKDVLITGEGANIYATSNSSSQKYMYALLRCNYVVPDDIFVPISMKDKVTVIRRIQFVDIEVDYGEFLSNIYFIKIKLKPGEKLPLYLTSRKGSSSKRYYLFSRTDKYKVDCIYSNYYNLYRKENNPIISLSELYNMPKNQN